MKQGMMGTRKITRSIVVEQAIAMYFKDKRNEYYTSQGILPAPNMLDVFFGDTTPEEVGF